MGGTDVSIADAEGHTGTGREQRRDGAGRERHGKDRRPQ